MLEEKMGTEDSKKKKMTSPCDNCKDVDNFSFEVCAVKCQKFLAHLKEVFAKNESPCKEKDASSVLCQKFILGESGMAPSAFLVKKETLRLLFIHMMENIHGKADVDDSADLI
jgi:hypothetical protein